GMHSQQVYRAAGQSQAEQGGEDVEGPVERTRAQPPCAAVQIDEEGEHVREQNHEAEDADDEAGRELQPARRPFEKSLIAQGHVSRSSLTRRTYRDRKGFRPNCLTLPPPPGRWLLASPARDHAVHREPSRPGEEERHER